MASSSVSADKICGTPRKWPCSSHVICAISDHEPNPGAEWVPENCPLSYSTALLTSTRTSKPLGKISGRSPLARASHCSTNTRSCALVSGSRARFASSRHSSALSRQRSALSCSDIQPPDVNHVGERERWSGGSWEFSRSGPRRSAETRAKEKTRSVEFRQREVAAEGRTGDLRQQHHFGRTATTRCDKQCCPGMVGLMSLDPSLALTGRIAMNKRTVRKVHFTLSGVSPCLSMRRRNIATTFGTARSSFAHACDVLAVYPRKEPA